MPIDYCDFLAGCIGGACGTLVGHPLDTIKAWQQATNSTIKHATYHIMVHNNNGVYGLFRGMMFPLCTAGILNSILFGVYGNLVRGMQSRCDKEEQKDLFKRHIFISGSIAGFVQSFIACPVELIKVRVQTYNYQTLSRELNPIFPSRLYTFLTEYLYVRQTEKYTPWNCCKEIFEKEGFLGFFRGLSPMICRDVFPYGIYMLAYEHILAFVADTNYFYLHRLKTGCGRTGLEMTIAGSLAGFLSWLLVIPFDVIKTIVQAEPNMTAYNSIYHCVCDNVKKNGWQIIFRGSWILIIRSLPVNAVTFIGYDYTIQKCSDIRNKYQEKL